MPVGAVDWHSTALAYQSAFALFEPKKRMLKQDQSDECVPAVAAVRENRLLLGSSSCEARQDSFFERECLTKQRSEALQQQ